MDATWNAAPTAAELEAAAELHHQLFTGLILALAGHHGQAHAAELVRRTFARQHDERFVPGLRTLGLAALPAAIACAQYIYLANRAGGLDVHYARESDRKAWVRYPPPRWAYEGAAICALDDRVTEAFLRGFHARCGPSLGNPCLRFVCTAMTTNGDPGLEGYFEECAAPLADDARLAFDLGEPGPAFDPRNAPALPWPDDRAPVAKRNYAVRYIEIMLPAALEVLGGDEGARLAQRTARLIGLQLYRRTADALGIEGDSRASFVRLLAALNRGTGNTLARVDEAAGIVQLERFRLGADPEVFDCWSGLWRGALAAHARSLRIEREGPWGWRVS